MGDAGRVLSLRTRVVLASALASAVVVVVAAALLATLLGQRELRLLDQRLDTIAGAAAPRVDLAQPGSLGELLGARRTGAITRALVPGLVLTVRPAGGPARSTAVGGPAGDLPERSPGRSTAGVAGVEYRLVTVALADGGTLSAGLPDRDARAQATRIRRLTVLSAVVAALVAALLAWAASGPATRPLHALRDRTRALGGRPGPHERAGLTAPPVSSARETRELAGALSGWLDRVVAAGADADRALVGARDFAAAAAHELRTPLTSMRTDLEVLQAHPQLPAAERDEVLQQVLATQRRVEATLTALGQLAAGDLPEQAAQDQVDLADVVAQAVAAARRSAPAGITIDAELPAEEVVVRGSAAGLRLAVDNLLANAVRHSGGSEVRARLAPSAGRVAVLVDDDGVGVPAQERLRVFDRFTRGVTARGAGSGLGLALVAQQAALHGGRAWLEAGPAGGSRAVLDLPLAVPSTSQRAAESGTP